MQDRLNERKLKILQAVVDDYITTAVPVGSRTIAKKYLDWSSATIRNEMMDLEELGYLGQPHTSAGRVPSEKAYRLYVERLMQVSELNPNEISVLQSYLDRRSKDLRRIYRDAAQAISNVTTYTSFVLPPDLRQMTINRIQLVPVTSHMALLVIVTEAGVFKDTFIKIGGDYPEGTLNEISNMLRRELTGLTLEAAQQKLLDTMQGIVREQQALLTSVLEAIDEQSRGSQSGELMLGGRTNIMQHPEYADIAKARSFLDALESKDSLLPLMQKGYAMEFTVSIGSENAHLAMKDASIITVRYRIDDTSMGTMGVIGPTRMNYAHVVSVLRYMKNIINRVSAEDTELLLEEGDEDDNTRKGNHGRNKNR
ncbi:MAG: heat-inducible transcriptional repressor HrcA [Christensenellales bacterium]|jgi:heat-inducible transcriptional repressor